MEQKEVILFKSKVNKISTNSKYKFRAIVRYAIILVMVALVSYSLFEIKGPIQDQSDAYAAIIHVTVIALIIFIAQIALKMNQLYFNGSTFNITMVIISLGYATFLAIYHRNAEMVETKELIKMLYWFAPILLINTIWVGGTSYFERNTRPFLSSMLKWKFINNILALILVSLAYVFARNYSDVFGNANHKSIDLKDKGTFMFVFTMGILVLSIGALWLVRVLLHRKLLKTDDMLKNVSLSLAVIITIPLTLWYVITYVTAPEEIYDYIMLGIDVLTLILVVWFTTLKKSRITSPLVAAVVYSAALLVIWMNKFAMEYAAGRQITPEWESMITLISISVVILMIFIKNDPSTKAKSFSLLLFAVFIAVYTLMEWTLSGWTDGRLDLNDLLEIVGISYDEALNTFVMISAMALVTSSLLAWYKVQSKINHNLQVKLRKEAKNG